MNECSTLLVILMDFDIGYLLVPGDLSYLNNVSTEDEVEFKDPKDTADYAACQVKLREVLGEYEFYSRKIPLEEIKALWSRGVEVKAITVSEV